MLEEQTTTLPVDACTENLPAWPATHTDAGTFAPPTKYTCRTLDKTGDKEPIFVLRAQDVLAPDVIRIWANLLRDAGGDPAKVQHARDCADAFEAWGRDHTRKIPD